MVAKLFVTKCYTDITIVCSDATKLEAHRNVLARSTVFAKLFEEESNEIRFNDVDGATMQELLRFIYTNEVQNFDTLTEKLFYCAKKFNLPDMKLMCVQKFVCGLSLRNIFEQLRLAERLKEQKLVDQCIDFINL